MINIEATAASYTEIFATKSDDGSTDGESDNEKEVSGRSNKRSTSSNQDIELFDSNTPTLAEVTTTKQKRDQVLKLAIQYTKEIKNLLNNIDSDISEKYRTSRLNYILGKSFKNTEDPVLFFTQLKNNIQYANIWNGLSNELTNKSLYNTTLNFFNNHYDANRNPKLITDEIYIQFEKHMHYIIDFYTAIIYKTDIKNKKSQEKFNQIETKKLLTTAQEILDKYEIIVKMLESAATNSNDTNVQAPI